jgi:branched-chain amino acid transport system permease protein
MSIQLLLGSLTIGIINGAFYAILSLGLSITFGVLRIANFTHGANYMMGAFFTWMALNYLGLGYWWALVLAPLTIGILAVAFERLLLWRMYPLHHLYGLLLTLGLSLVLEGVFLNAYGAGGMPYPVPPSLRGAVNLGFMIMPYYRLWVIVFSLIICLLTWYVVERTRIGSYLRAATENPTMVGALGVNVPLLLSAAFGVSAALAALTGVLAVPLYSANPLMGVDILIVIFAIVVIGGLGSLTGSILTAFGIGIFEALGALIYPEFSTTAVFVLMIIVLLVRPLGLFGKAY